MNNPEQSLYGKAVLPACIALLIMLMLAVAAGADPQVTFEDSRLEAAIRENLGKPEEPIFKRDLLTISRLDASNCGIINLAGIENLRRLTTLNLEDNQVKDLSPLRSLTKLRKLKLGQNNIYDLKEINFGVLNRWLRELDLRNNYLTDLTLLGEFTALTRLNLRGNWLNNLAPLTNLTSLIYLNIHSNPQIASIAPLADLVNLNILIMRNVPVGDEICYLQGLTNLHRLNLRNTGINSTDVLAKLMAAGALQDNPKKKITAEVDLRNNTIYSGGAGYRSMIGYWENVGLRNPPSLSSLIFPAPPIFSTPGGFYEGEFNLQLSGPDPEQIILYTLDGSEPDINNIESSADRYQINYFYPETRETGRLVNRADKTYVYCEPIAILDRTGQENDLADIITTYREAPDIWWKQPDHNIYKGTVVKARTYDGAGYSKTVTHSYFIGVKERFSLPVLSLVIEPRDFFSYDTGIYVPGKKYFDGSGTENLFLKKGNYRHRGREWERPAHIEYYGNDGQLAFSQHVGIRIHGGGSRDQPQKAFRIYARSEYDDANQIYYDFFPAANELQGGSIVYKRLLMRGSGNEGDHILDAVAHSIMSNSEVGIQRSTPIIHFVNGEYWGLTQVRDRLDRYHLAYRYHLDADNIVILDAPWGIVSDGLEAGVEEDMHLYNDLYRYAMENDLSKDEHYEHIKSLLCLNSYLDYQIMFIYLTNVDWYGSKHFKFWRVRETGGQPYADGKWRVMVYDFDLAFLNSQINLLADAIHPDGGGKYSFGEGPDSPKTALFRSLLKNKEFKNLFINRFADHINSTFHPDRVAGIIDYHYESIREEIEEHEQRWGSDATSERRIASWKEFAKERPEYQRRQIMESFGIPGTATLTLKTRPEKGIIKINTLEITNNTPGMDTGEWSGVYFQGVPVQVTAIANPGYRFTGWVETGQSESGITLLLTGDMTLTANFTKQAQDS